MSWDVKSAQIEPTTPQWELAKRLLDKEETPQDILELIFTTAMKKLETIANQSFEASIKERVWKKVFTERVKGLNEILIREFCDKILGNFSNENVNKMIEEHKLTGVIRFSENSIELQINFHCNESSIKNTVKQKAHSMIQSCIPEIVKAINEEGIKLPEPKNSRK